MLTDKMVVEYIRLVERHMELTDGKGPARTNEEEQELELVKSEISRFRMMIDWEHERRRHEAEK